MVAAYFKHGTVPNLLLLVVTEERFRGSEHESGQTALKTPSKEQCYFAEVQAFMLPWRGTPLSDIHCVRRGHRGAHEATASRIHVAKKHTRLLISDLESAKARREILTQLDSSVRREPAGCVISTEH